MNEQTVALILGLLPIAERLIFDVGGRLVELNTAELGRDDLVKALESSKGRNWPELKFHSPAAMDDPETAG